MQYQNKKQYHILQYDTFNKYVETKRYKNNALAYILHIFVPLL